MKLTKEQILSIAKLSNIKTDTDMASEFSVSIRTIQYWKKKLREAGHKVEKIKRGPKQIQL